MKVLDHGDRLSIHRAQVFPHTFAARGARFQVGHPGQVFVTHLQCQLPGDLATQGVRMLCIVTFLLLPAHLLQSIEIQPGVCAVLVLASGIGSVEAQAGGSASGTWVVAQPDGSGAPSIIYNVKTGESYLLDGGKWRVIEYPESIRVKTSLPISAR